MCKLCSWPEEVREISMQMNHHNTLSLETCIRYRDYFSTYKSVVNYNMYFLRCDFPVGRNEVLPFIFSASNT